ncbi:MAG: hypothetical protein GEU94_05550, partial [Micromonosporaceae bacterium]|nr:hypothetical protein [Micromonosporaceae bacterium]
MAETAAGARYGLARDPISSDLVARLVSSYSDLVNVTSRIANYAKQYPQQVDQLNFWVRHLDRHYGALELALKQGTLTLDTFRDFSRVVAAYHDAMNVAATAPGVVQVNGFVSSPPQQTPQGERRDTARVSVIADAGRRWVVSETRDFSRMESVDQAKAAARTLIAIAGANPAFHVNGQPPRIEWRFPHGVDESVAAALEGIGVTVVGQRLASAPSLQGAQPVTDAPRPPLAADMVVEEQSLRTAPGELNVRLRSISRQIHDRGDLIRMMGTDVAAPPSRELPAPPGHVLVEVHGDGRFVTVPDGRLTDREFADLIRNGKAWRVYQRAFTQWLAAPDGLRGARPTPPTIVLLSPNASRGLAQALSAELQAPVIAPDAMVWNEGGVVRVGHPAQFPGGMTRDPSQPAAWWLLRPDGAVRESDIGDYFERAQLRRAMSTAPLDTPAPVVDMVQTLHRIAHVQADLARLRSRHPHLQGLAILQSQLATNAQFIEGNLRRGADRLMPAIPQTVERIAYQAGQLARAVNVRAVNMAVNTTLPDGSPYSGTVHIVDDEGRRWVTVADDGTAPTGSPAAENLVSRVYHQMLAVAGDTAFQDVDGRAPVLQWHFPGGVGPRLAQRIEQLVAHDPRTLQAVRVRVIGRRVFPAVPPAPAVGRAAVVGPPDLPGGHATQDADRDTLRLRRTRQAELEESSAEQDRFVRTPNPSTPRIFPKDVRDKLDLHFTPRQASEVEVDQPDAPADTHPLVEPAAAADVDTQLDSDRREHLAKREAARDSAQAGYQSGGLRRLLPGSGRRAVQMQIKGALAELEVIAADLGTLTGRGQPVGVSADRAAEAERAAWLRDQADDVVARLRSGGLARLSGRERDQFLEQNLSAPARGLVHELTYLQNIRLMREPLAEELAEEHQRDLPDGEFQAANDDIGPVSTGPASVPGNTPVAGRRWHPTAVSRVYGGRGGLRPPLADHEQRPADLLRQHDGVYFTPNDPREVVGLVNVPGPDNDPTRGNNDVDATMALHDTMRGRPAGAAPRTFDGFADGDVRQPLGRELGGEGRVEDRGVRLQRPAPVLDDAYAAVDRALRAAGPGSFAYVVTHREGAEPRMTGAYYDGAEVLHLDAVTGEWSNEPIGGSRAVAVDAAVVDRDDAPVPFADAPLSQLSSRSPTPDYLDALPAAERQAWLDLARRVQDDEHRNLDVLTTTTWPPEAAALHADLKDLRARLELRVLAEIISDPAELLRALRSLEQVARWHNMSLEQLLAEMWSQELGAVTPADQRVEAPQQFDPAGELTPERLARLRRASTERVTQYVANHAKGQVRAELWRADPRLWAMLNSDYGHLHQSYDPYVRAVEAELGAEPSRLDVAAPYGKPRGLRAVPQQHIDQLREAVRKAKGDRPSPDVLARHGDPEGAAGAYERFLAHVSTYLHGDPRPAAPTTIDGFVDGDITRPYGEELDAAGRTQDETGAPILSVVRGLLSGSDGRELAANRGEVARAHQQIEEVLRQAGHGSMALVLPSSPDDPNADRRGFTAVNHEGTITYISGTSKKVLDKPPYPGLVDNVDVLVLDGAGEPVTAQDGLWSASPPLGQLAARPPATGHVRALSAEDQFAWIDQALDAWSSGPDTPAGLSAELERIHRGLSDRRAQAQFHALYDAVSRDSARLERALDSEAARAVAQGRSLEDRLVDQWAAQLGGLLRRDGVPTLESARSALVAPDLDVIRGARSEADQSGVMHVSDSGLARVAAVAPALAAALSHFSLPLVGGRVDLTPYQPAAAADFAHRLSPSRPRTPGTEHREWRQLQHDREQARRAFRRAYQARPALLELLETHEFYYAPDGGRMVLAHRDLAEALGESVSREDPLHVDGPYVSGPDHLPEPAELIDDPALPAGFQYQGGFTGTAPELFDETLLTETDGSGMVSQVVHRILQALGRLQPERLRALGERNVFGNYQIRLHRTSPSSLRGWARGQARPRIARPIGRVSMELTARLPLSDSTRPGRAPVWMRMLEKALAGVDQAPEPLTGAEAAQTRSIAPGRGYSRLTRTMTDFELAETLVRLTGMAAEITAPRGTDQDASRLLAELARHRLPVLARLGHELVDGSYFVAAIPEIHGDQVRVRTDVPRGARRGVVMAEELLSVEEFLDAVVGGLVHIDPAEARNTPERRGPRITATEAKGTRFRKTRATPAPVTVEEGGYRALREAQLSGLIRDARGSDQPTPPPEYDGAKPADGRVLITPHQGEPFWVRIVSVELEQVERDGELVDVLAETFPPAETIPDAVRGRHADGVVTIAVDPRVPDSEIDAAVAHEIAEVIAERRSRLRRLRRMVSHRPDKHLLSPDGAGQERKSPEDEGRLAQLRTLGHKLTTETDPAQIAALERDLARWVRALGLDEASPGFQRRREAVRADLPAYAMDLIARFGQVRPDAASLERTLMRTLGVKINSVAAAESPHGAELLVEGLDGDLVHLLVTSGAAYGQTDARIAASGAQEDSRLADRYVIRIPQGFDDAGVDAAIAEQIERVLAHRRDGAPLNPATDPWATVHPHHFPSDDADPASQRMAAEQASVAGNEIAEIREGGQLVWGSAEAVFAAITTWRQAFAIENAFLDPTGPNPYLTFNADPVANLPVDPLRPSPRRDGVRKLAELLGTHRDVQPGTTRHREAMQAFGDAAQMLLQRPAPDGREDVVRTLLVAVHTEVFGYPPSLPADMGQQTRVNRKEFPAWLGGRLATRPEMTASVRAEHALRAAMPELERLGVDLSELLPPETRVATNPGWTALVDVIDNLHFRQKDAARLLAAAIRFVVDHGAVDQDSAGTRTVRLAELAGLVGHFHAAFQSHVERLKYRFKSPNSLWAMSKRAARALAAGQATDTGSEFYREAGRALEHDRRAAAASGRGAVTIQVTGRERRDALRSLLRPHLDSLGFASPTAAAYQSARADSGVYPLMARAVPRGLRNRVDLFHDALGATLRDPDRTTIDRRPDGRVEIVSRRVAHDQNGNLVRRRGVPVGYTATVVLWPDGAEMTATVESFRAGPDPELEGWAHARTTREQVLEAVTKIDPSVAVEVEAETVFPALDKPNTVIVKPFSEDSFEATIDYDPVSGKLTAEADGKRAQAVVDAARNTSPERLAREVESALADAIAQLQAERLGAPKAEFRQQNVLREGPLGKRQREQLAQNDAGQALPRSFFTTADHGRQTRIRVDDRHARTAATVRERAYHRLKVIHGLRHAGLANGQEDAGKRRQGLDAAMRAIVEQYGDAKPSRRVFGAGFLDRPMGVVRPRETVVKNLYPDGAGLAAMVLAAVAAQDPSLLWKTAPFLVAGSIATSVYDVWSEKRKKLRELENDRAQEVRRKERARLTELEERDQLDGEQAPARRHEDLVPTKLTPNRPETVVKQAPEASYSAMRYLVTKLFPRKPKGSSSPAEAAAIVEAMPYLTSAPGVAKAISDMLLGVPTARQDGESELIHGRFQRQLRMEAPSGQLYDLLRKADPLIRQLAQLAEAGQLPSDRGTLTAMLERLVAAHGKFAEAYQAHLAGEKDTADEALKRTKQRRRGLRLRRGSTYPVTRKAHTGMPRRRAIAAREALPGAMQAAVVSGVVSATGAPALFHSFGAAPLVAGASSAVAEQRYQSDKIADSNERKRDLQRKINFDALGRLASVIESLYEKVGGRPAERLIGSRGKVLALRGKSEPDLSVATAPEATVLSPKWRMFLARQILKSGSSSAVAGLTIFLVFGNPYFALGVGGAGLVRGAVRSWREWRVERQKIQFKEQQEDLERQRRAETTAPTDPQKLLDTLEEIAQKAEALAAQLDGPTWVSDDVAAVREALRSHGSPALVIWFNKVAEEFGSEHSHRLDSFVGQFGDTADERAMRLHERWNEVVNELARSAHFVDPATELLKDALVDTDRLVPWADRISSNPDWRQVVEAFNRLKYPRKVAPWLHAAALQFAFDNGAVTEEAQADGSTTQQVDLPLMADLIDYFGQRMPEEHGRGKRALTAAAKQLQERDRDAEGRPVKDEDGKTARERFFEGLANRLKQDQEAIDEAWRDAEVGFQTSAAAAYQSQNPRNHVVTLPEAMAGRGVIDPEVVRYWRALELTRTRPQRRVERLLDDGDTEILLHRIAEYPDGGPVTHWGRPVVMTLRLIQRPDGETRVESFQARPSRKLARQIRRDKAQYEAYSVESLVDPALDLPPDLRQIAASAPEQVRDWWRGLRVGEQRALITDRPEWIGNQDGVPAWARDEANRIVLERERQASETRRHELERRLKVGRQAGERRLKWLAKQLDEEQESLRTISAIQSRLRVRGQGTRPAFLMGFSRQDTGPGVRAIVAVNSPDVADHVVTFVHGMGSNRFVDWGIEIADLMAEDARMAAPRQTTSVITWIGYDAPHYAPDPNLETTRLGRLRAEFGSDTRRGVQESATTHYAKQAAPLLRRFQRGLRATHQGPPSHNTVLGHSYGSVVTAHTAAGPGGLDTDDTIIVGSPGMSHESLDRLGTVWATRADWDAIGIAAGTHGLDPVGQRFGARVFRGAPGSWRDMRETHLAYWDDDNSASEDIAHIVTGQPDQVSPAVAEQGRPLLQALLGRPVATYAKLRRAQHILPPTDLLGDRDLPAGAKPRLSQSDKAV